MYLKEQSF